MNYPISKLMLSQFCTAIVDHSFKFIATLFLISNGSVSQSVFVNVLLVLPYILFSGVAGWLADAYPKRSVMVGSKFLEIASIFLIGFALNVQSQVMVLAGLFLLGSQAALFSPSKYGTLREVYRGGELGFANGKMEFINYVGILLGGCIGSVLLNFLSNTSILLPIFWLIVSVSGLYITSLLPKIEPSNKVKTEPSTFGSFIVLFKLLKDKELAPLIIGVTYFWSLGAALQVNLLIHAKKFLQLNDLFSGLLSLSLGLGIGIGSQVAGRLSKERVEVGMVPFGSLGLALSCFFIWLYPYSNFVAYTSLFILGFSGGIFVVPLGARFQDLSPESEVGERLSALNLCTFAGVIIFSIIMYLILGEFGLDSSFIFLALSLGSLGITIAGLLLMPGLFLRSLNWIVTNCLYKIEKVNRDSVPETGGALIVCNHSAYTDPLIILASVKRPIRFLVWRPIYELPVFNAVLKSVNAIPIDPGDGPKAILRSLHEAKQAIQNGEVVCIFAEGAITRIGRLLTFEKGLEKIIKGTNCPIVPVYIDQLWGSLFSFKEGKVFWKMPKEIPYPVSIRFADPLPATTSASEVREKVQELSAESAINRKERDPNLATAILSELKRHPKFKLFADSSGVSVSGWRALFGICGICQNLKVQKGEYVGILLPPSVGGALANFAVTLNGGIPVNLNFTTGNEGIEEGIKRCNITKVLTSPQLLKKLNLELKAETIYIENLIPKKLNGALLWNFISTFILPREILQKKYPGLSTKSSDVATILFSSGSTSKPKGVILSHKNILSNVHALYDLFQVSKEDGVCGSLPFFHSFGLTGTLFFPVIAGIRVFYHPNPLDVRELGEIIWRERLTILLTTPTFLNGFIKRIEADRLSSVRLLVVGAEKLTAQLSAAFEEKFKITPLEGYGCTELSPVVALNIPDFKSDRVYQIGRKSGTIGHPIPGVAVKVVDPNTFEYLPPGSEGMLMVKGPNVMKGYLDDPEKTAEVILDGWYATGDIAKVDDDGFITITDRLSRFSKIGGEMVPHLKIEEVLQKHFDLSERTFIVIGIPDDRKGERLICLHTTNYDTPTLQEALSNSELPNLWQPKEFKKIETFPLLGSGKLDLKKVKEIASN